MKITFGELIGAVVAFRKLSAQDMPVREAYDLSKRLKKISAEMEFYDQKRKELFEKYGEKSGDNMVIKSDLSKEFLAEAGELARVEVDLDVLPITGFLDKFEKCLLSASDIEALAPFIGE